jgi:N-acetylmuramoyl-L-alanine amidase
MKNKVLVASLVAIIIFVILVTAGFMFKNKNGNKNPSESTTATDDVLSTQNTEPTTGITKGNYIENTTFFTPDTSKLTFSYPVKTSFKTSNPRLSFMGSASNDKELVCNGTNIQRASCGAFAFDVMLELGENVYEFIYGDEVKTFNINYEMSLISGVSPKGKITAKGGTEIEISATCKAQSEVYAEINGTKIDLVPSGSGDMVLYSATCLLPVVSENTELGNIKIYANHNGETETYTAGSVTVIGMTVDYSYFVSAAPYAEEPIYTSLYQTNTVLKTAYSNHGLGTAPMVEVLKNHAECTPNENADDKSSPLTTPLLQGTFDYITGVCSYEDELMFNLQCGKKIYEKQVKVLQNGYKMPQNRLSAVGCEIKSDATELKIASDWAVPTNVILNPQNYYANAQGRPFAVASVDSSYLDIVFYYTDRVFDTFDVSKSKSISAVEWINVGVSGNTTLRIHFKLAGYFYGYHIELVGNTYKIRVNDRPAVQKTKTVMLDAGHGFDDTGTYSVYSGIYEKDINLSLAWRVKNKLEQQGINVVMTRYGDEDVTLDERTLVGRTSPDCFVSIHCDGDPNTTTSSGTHTFYYYNYSMPLASSIHSNLVTAYQSIYPVGTPEYAAINKGAKFFPYQVTRLEECPSVLVECGYLTNVSDCNVLISEGGQELISGAIANGILYYLNNF